MIAFAAAIIVSYLLGSLPTSILVGRFFFGKDIRKEGSGNAGGTNAFRVFGWKAGIFVVAVDVAKGAAAVLLTSRITSGGPVSPDAARLASGAAATIGHVWTVFAGFRGGKGVATAAGALAVAAPLPFLAALAAFVLTLLSTGIVSVGSIAAAVVFPLSALAFRLIGAGTPDIVVAFAFLLGVFILWTHRKNIGRLRDGSENRFEKLRILPRLFGKKKSDR